MADYDETTPMEVILDGTSHDVVEGSQEGTQQEPAGSSSQPTGGANKLPLTLDDAILNPPSVRPKKIKTGRVCFHWTPGLIKHDRNGFWCDYKSWRKAAERGLSGDPCGTFFSLYHQQRLIGFHSSYRVHTQHGTSEIKTNFFIGQPRYKNGAPWPKAFVISGSRRLGAPINNNQEMHQIIFCEYAGIPNTLVTKDMMRYPNTFAQPTPLNKDEEGEEVENGAPGGDGSLKRQRKNEDVDGTPVTTGVVASVGAMPHGTYGRFQRSYSADAYFDEDDDPAEGAFSDSYNQIERASSDGVNSLYAKSITGSDFLGYHPKDLGRAIYGHESSEAAFQPNTSTLRDDRLVDPLTETCPIPFLPPSSLEREKRNKDAFSAFGHPGGSPIPPLLPISSTSSMDDEHFRLNREGSSNPSFGGGTPAHLTDDSAPFSPSEILSKKRQIQHEFALKNSLDDRFLLRSPSPSPPRDRHPSPPTSLGFRAPRAGLESGRKTILLGKEDTIRPIPPPSGGSSGHQNSEDKTKNEPLGQNVLNKPSQQAVPLSPSQKGIRINVEDQLCMMCHTYPECTHQAWHSDEDLREVYPSLPGYFFLPEVGLICEICLNDVDLSDPSGPSGEPVRILWCGTIDCGNLAISHFGSKRNPRCRECHHKRIREATQHNLGEISSTLTDTGEVPPGTIFSSKLCQWTQRQNPSASRPSHQLSTRNPIRTNGRNRGKDLDHLLHGTREKLLATCPYAPKCEIPILEQPHRLERKWTHLEENYLEQRGKSDRGKLFRTDDQPPHGKHTNGPSREVHPPTRTDYPPQKETRPVRYRGDTADASSQPQWGRRTADRPGEFFPGTPRDSCPFRGTTLGRRQDGAARHENERSSSKNSVHSGSSSGNPFPQGTSGRGNRHEGNPPGKFAYPKIGTNNPRERFGGLSQKTSVSVSQQITQPFGEVFHVGGTPIPRIRDQQLPAGASWKHKLPNSNVHNPMGRSKANTLQNPSGRTPFLFGKRVLPPPIGQGILGRRRFPGVSETPPVFPSHAQGRIPPDTSTPQENLYRRQSPQQMGRREEEGNTAANRDNGPYNSRQHPTKRFASVESAREREGNITLPVPYLPLSPEEREIYAEPSSEPDSSFGEFDYHSDFPTPRAGGEPGKREQYYKLPTHTGRVGFTKTARKTPKDPAVGVPASRGKAHPRDRNFHLSNFPNSNFVGDSFINTPDQGHDRRGPVGSRTVQQGLRPDLHNVDGFPSGFSDNDEPTPRGDGNDFMVNPRPDKASRSPFCSEHHPQRGGPVHIIPSDEHNPDPRAPGSTTGRNQDPGIPRGHESGPGMEDPPPTNRTTGRKPPVGDSYPEGSHSVHPDDPRNHDNFVVPPPNTKCFVVPEQPHHGRGSPVEDQQISSQNLQNDSCIPHGGNFHPSSRDNHGTPGAASCSQDIHPTVTEHGIPATNAPRTPAKLISEEEIGEMIRGALLKSRNLPRYVEFSDILITPDSGLLASMGRAHGGKLYNPGEDIPDEDFAECLSAMARHYGMRPEQCEVGDDRKLSVDLKEVEKRLEQQESSRKPMFSGDSSMLTDAGLIEFANKNCRPTADSSRWRVAAHNIVKLGLKVVEKCRHGQTFEDVLAIMWDSLKHAAIANYGLSGAEAASFAADPPCFEDWRKKIHVEIIPFSNTWSKARKMTETFERYIESCKQDQICSGTDVRSGEFLVCGESLSSYFDLLSVKIEPNDNPQLSHFLKFENKWKTAIEARVKVNQAIAKDHRVVANEPHIIKENLFRQSVSLEVSFEEMEGTFTNEHALFPNRKILSTQNVGFVVFKRLRNSGSPVDLRTFSGKMKWPPLARSKFFDKEYARVFIGTPEATLCIRQNDSEKKLEHLTTTLKQQEKKMAEMSKRLLAPNQGGGGAGAVQSAEIGKPTRNMARVYPVIPGSLPNSGPPLEHDLVVPMFKRYMWQTWQTPPLAEKYSISFPRDKFGLRWMTAKRKNDNSVFWKSLRPESICWLCAANRCPLGVECRNSCLKQNPPLAKWANTMLLSVFNEGVIDDIARILHQYDRDRSSINYVTACKMANEEQTRYEPIPDGIDMDAFTLTLKILTRTKTETAVPAGPREGTMYSIDELSEIRKKFIPLLTSTILFASGTSGHSPSGGVSLLIPKWTRGNGSSTSALGAAFVTPRSSLLPPGTISADLSPDFREGHM